MSTSRPGVAFFPSGGASLGAIEVDIAAVNGTLLGELIARAHADAHAFLDERDERVVPLRRAS